MDPYALTGMKSLRRRLKAIFCSLTHLAEAYPEKRLIIISSYILCPKNLLSAFVVKKNSLFLVAFQMS